MVGVLSGFLVTCEYTVFAADGDEVDLVFAPIEGQSKAPKNYGNQFQNSFAKWPKPRAPKRQRPIPCATSSVSAGPSP